MKKSEFVKMDVSTMKKSELVNLLSGITKMKLDKNLMDRVKYTLTQAKKSLAKVTLSDLRELISEVQLVAAGSITNAVPAEASLKKPSKSKDKKSKKSEPVEEPTEKDDEEEDEEEEKPAKKSKGLKKVKTAPQKVPKNGFLPVASMFPEELSIETTDGEITLKRVHEKYHSVQEIREATENGVSLFIAAYWTKLHIKKYGYKEQYSLMNDAPKSFPDDLDILNVVVACDSMERVFAMSNYTEAMYRFDKPDFDPIEDEDPSDGSKFTVRVSNGLEFEVYELAE